MLEESEGWTRLRNAFAALRAEPFPANGGIPDLLDAHASLVEYDAYIAGIVTQLLQNGEPPQHLLRSAPELRGELSAKAVVRSEPVRTRAEAMLRYLDRLETVVECARDVVANATPRT